jgi:hypothetical protein
MWSPSPKIKTCRGFFLLMVLHLLVIAYRMLLMNYEFGIDFISVKVHPMRAKIGFLAFSFLPHVSFDVLHVLAS